MSRVLALIEVEDGLELEQTLGEGAELVREIDGFDQHIFIFHTPESMAELQTYIAGMAPGERMVANLILGMTWNFVCRQLRG